MAQGMIFYLRISSFRNCRTFSEDIQGHYIKYFHAREICGTSGGSGVRRTKCHKGKRVVISVLIIKGLLLCCLTGLHTKSRPAWRPAFGMATTLALRAFPSTHRIIPSAHQCHSSWQTFLYSFRRLALCRLQFHDHVSMFEITITINYILNL